MLLELNKPRERAKPREIVHLVDSVANVDDFGKALGEVRCDKAAMPEINHNFPDVRNEPQHKLTLTCTQATVIMRARGPQ